MNTAPKNLYIVEKHIDRGHGDTSVGVSVCTTEKGAKSSATTHLNHLKYWYAMRWKGHVVIRKFEVGDEVEATTLTLEKSL